MNEELSLVDGIVTELRKEWNPEELKGTIDNKWDHVLIQAFFFNLGRKLGFRVGCEKFRKWDVAWVKDNDSTIQIEIELGSQTSIAKTFSKICKTIDKGLEETVPKSGFLGILLVRNELDKDKDYFFNWAFDRTNEEIYKIYYPQNEALMLLVIDLETEVYRYANIGPGRKYKIIHRGDLTR